MSESATEIYCCRCRGSHSPYGPCPAPLTDNANLAFNLAVDTLPGYIRNLKRLAIEQALKVTNGNSTLAAKLLEVKRTTLVEMRRQLGLTLKAPSRKKELCTHIKNIN